MTTRTTLGMVCEPNFVVTSNLLSDDVLHLHLKR